MVLVPVGLWLKGVRMNSMWRSGMRPYRGFCLLAARNTDQVFLPEPICVDSFPADRRQTVR